MTQFEPGITRIVVGSANEVKVNAVKELASDYDFLGGVEVRGVDVPSGVSSQPKSLDETIQGAMNRAKAAFCESGYGFGIESGLMQVPHSKTGVMDICVCAIFDGSQVHLGLSSAFECPRDVTELMLGGGIDMQTAFYQCGYTKNPKLGAAEGAIGILTKGRIDRKEYTKQAVRTALIHLEALQPA